MTGPRPARGSVVRLDLAGAALASAARQPMELEERLIQILDEVGPSLHRYLVFLGAAPGEADDLIQETLIRLSDRLRAREPIVDVRAWVFRVAHNLGLNQVRDRKYLETLGGPEWEALVSMQRDPAPGPEEILLEKEKLARLDAAIATLSPLERQCVHLRVEGFRYREIADSEFMPELMSRLTT